MFSKGFTKHLTASLLVLVTCLIVTYTSFYYTHVATEDKIQAYFDFRMREAIQLIENRIVAYEGVLRGTGGMFNASESVTRDGFKRYIASLRLADHFPGIQGVGYSILIRPEAKKSHIDTIRSEGFPTYSIYPEGERETYSSILYLEPFSDRNLRAFGYDMFSEPVRHVAMQRAIDNNNMSLSGKVRLVQESGTDEQAGFLMYKPIYERGKPHTLLSDRQENIIGWVYSVFRMNDFMAGVHGEQADDLDIEIYDGDTILDETLMFDSETSLSLEKPLNNNGLTVYRINVVDHVWTIRIRPSPLLELRFDTDKPFLVIVMGSIASFTLALIAWLLMTGRERAIEAAKKMNIELIDTQKELKIEQERTGELLTKRTSELREAQLQLFQAEKMETIGTLSAGIAHEVKNPLAVIQLGINYLQKTLQKDEGIDGVIQDMDNAVHRADSVIKELVDFSASKQLKLEKQEPNQIIEESLLLVKHELTKYNINVVKKLEKNIPLIEADRNKLQQVFINVYMNAIHAMGAKGTLLVRTYAGVLKNELKKHNMSATGQFKLTKNVVVIEIVDTGPGIKSEDENKIFEPFFTTKKAGVGTGLGLTVTENIVRLHNAYIDIKNHKEGGVIVSIIFKAI
jgi:signal transduction histidine kinase